MMESVMEFFRMGGHGFYVWSAYGLIASGLIYEIFTLRARRRAICQRLMREARAEQSALERH